MIKRARFKYADLSWYNSIFKPGKIYTIKFETNKSRYCTITADQLNFGEDRLWISTYLTYPKKSFTIISDRLNNIKLL